MKNERGYVCTVTFKDTRGEFWFGPKTNPEGSDLDESDRFNTNGLKPFSTKEEAQKARDEILRKRKLIEKVEIVRIELDITETEEDIELMKEENRLVVIADMEIGKELLGLAIEGGQKLGYVPGALIETNGRLPFTEFHQAEYAAQEVRRQAQSHVAIARLKIEPII